MSALALEAMLRHDGDGHYRLFVRDASTKKSVAEHDIQGVTAPKWDIGTDAVREARKIVRSDARAHGYKGDYRIFVWNWNNNANDVHKGRL